MERRVILSLSILLLLLSTASAQELTREQERRLSRIESEIFSPFCPGKVLKDCPSSGATELKSDLRQKIINGQSDQQVVKYLETLYGTEIHARPPMSGMGVWVWVVPGVFVGIAAVAFLVFLRRFIRN
jgi:cytochrome c-type biogenesis protein CcmH